MVPPRPTQVFKDSLIFLHENLRDAIFQSTHLQMGKDKPTLLSNREEFEILAEPLVQLLPDSLLQRSSAQTLIVAGEYIPAPACCTRCRSVCDPVQHGRLMMCDVCTQAFCEVGARLTWPSMQSDSISCSECSDYEGKTLAKEAGSLRASLSEHLVASVPWPLDHASSLCTSRNKCDPCSSRRGDLQLLCRYVVGSGVHASPMNLVREAALYQAAMKIRCCGFADTINGYCVEVPNGVYVVAHQACDNLSSQLEAYIEHRCQYPSWLPPFLSVDWTPGTRYLMVY